MRTSNRFRIAVLPGDGIGKEVMSACVEVLDTIQRRVGGFKLDLEYIHAGAEYFLEQGVDITEEAMGKVKQADAILLGAMGLQDVRFPNGTEIAPHLKIRTELGLFAGVRPEKAYPNTPRRLTDMRSQVIDFVVLRESTEGLFAEREKGVILEDREARAQWSSPVKPVKTFLISPSSFHGGENRKGEKAGLPVLTNRMSFAVWSFSGKSLMNGLCCFQIFRVTTTMSTPRLWI